MTSPLGRRSGSPATRSASIAPSSNSDGRWRRYWLRSVGGSGTGKRGRAGTGGRTSSIVSVEMGDGDTVRPNDTGSGVVVAGTTGDDTGVCAVVAATYVSSYGPMWM